MCTARWHVVAIVLRIVTAIDWINAVHHLSEVPKVEGISFAKVSSQESYEDRVYPEFVNCVSDIHCTVHIAISARWRHK